MESLEYDLMPRWQDEMLELGTSPLVELSGIAGFAMTQQYPALAPRAERVAEMLSAEGVLSETKTWYPRTVTVKAGRTMFGYHPAEVDATVTAVKDSSEAVPVAIRPRHSEFGFSTLTNVRTELAVARAMDTAMTDVARAGPVDQVEAVLEERFTAGQVEAIRAVCESEHRAVLLVGVAGAGKTTALRAITTAYEAEGWTVRGTSTSGAAARTLEQEAGMPANTTKSMLWHLDHHRWTLDDHTLVVIDEASMSSDAHLLRLLKAAERGGSRIVMVGDDRQLDAVELGGGFAALQARHPEAVHVLGENVRQQIVEERQTLAALRTGKKAEVAGAVQWYVDNDRVRIAADGREAVDLAVTAWAADVEQGVDAAMYAWTRAHVAALNEGARLTQIQAGRVDVGRETVLEDGRRFAPGDRVATFGGDTTDRSAKVVTSEKGWVVDVGWLDGVPGVIVEFDSGVQHIYAGETLDDIGWGWATTAHKAQGQTVDRGHLLADGGGAELGYMAMARGRQTNHVYVVADDPEMAISDLVAGWSRDAQDRWVATTDRVLRDPAKILEARQHEWPHLEPPAPELEVGQEWEIGG